MLDFYLTLVFIVFCLTTIALVAIVFGRTEIVTASIRTLHDAIKVLAGRLAPQKNDISEPRDRS